VSQKNKHTLDVENTINKTLCKDVEKKDLHIELNQENIDKMINELDVMQTDLIAMKNEKFTLEEQLNEIFSPVKELFCYYDKCRIKSTNMLNFKQHIQCHRWGLNNQCLWDKCKCLVKFGCIRIFHRHLVLHISQDVSYCPFDNCRLLIKNYGLPTHLRTKHAIFEEGIIEIMRNTYSGKSDYVLNPETFNCGISYEPKRPKTIKQTKNMITSQDSREMEQYIYYDSDCFNFERFIKTWNNNLNS
ncbi:hypothetical protein A3Q56_07967, partial [Intoshia linei]